MVNTGIWEIAPLYEIAGRFSVDLPVVCLPGNICVMPGITVLPESDFFVRDRPGPDEKSEVEDAPRLILLMVLRDHQISQR
jgi:hypothetical protein